ncbi:hypothetical protein VO419_004141 [Vibrio parahaemolyticus]|nr:hypothetical protein [Vibrio parahaemolyticus]
MISVPTSDEKEKKIIINDCLDMYDFKAEEHKQSAFNKCMEIEHLDPSHVHTLIKEHFNMFIIPYGTV